MTPWPSQQIAAETCSQISFEFFPPRTEEQKLILESTWQKLAPLASRLPVGDLRRRRLDAGRNAGNGRSAGCRDRRSCCAAHLLHGRERGDAARHPAALTGRRASIAWWCCAAIGLTAWPARDRSSTRTNWSAIFAASSVTLSGSRWPATRNFIPNLHRRDSDLFYFKQKVEAGADGAVTQYFYNADSLLPLSRRLPAAWVSIYPLRRASCRSPITGSCPASPRCAVRRFRSGSAGAWKAFGDDGASIRAFGLDVVTELCERLLAGRRARFAHLHAQPRQCQLSALAEAEPRSREQGSETPYSSPKIAT